MIHLLSSFIGKEFHQYKKYTSYDGKLFYKGYEIAFLHEGRILMRDDIHYFPIEFLLTYKFHMDVHDVPTNHWKDVLSSSDLLNLFVQYRER